MPCTKLVVPSMGSTTQSQSGLAGSFRIFCSAAVLAAGPGGTLSSPCMQAPAPQRRREGPSRMRAYVKEMLWHPRHHWQSWRAHQEAVIREGCHDGAFDDRLHLGVHLGQQVARVTLGLDHICACLLPYDARPLLRRLCGDLHLHPRMSFNSRPHLPWRWRRRIRGCEAPGSEQRAVPRAQWERFECASQAAQLRTSARYRITSTARDDSIQVAKQHTGITAYIKDKQGARRGSNAVRRAPSSPRPARPRREGGCWRRAPSRVIACCLRASRGHLRGSRRRGLRCGACSGDGGRALAKDYGAEKRRSAPWRCKRGEEGASSRTDDVPWRRQRLLAGDDGRGLALSAHRR